MRKIGRLIEYDIALETAQKWLSLPRGERPERETLIGETLNQNKDLHKDVFTHLFHGFCRIGLMSERIREGA